MSSLFDRSYICQVCGNTFTSKQVKTSAVRTKERKKDFHALFSGENPTYYGVICCPMCGYAKFENDFKQELDSSERAITEQTISRNWRTQNFCEERDTEMAIIVHKIALANYKVHSAKQSILGKLYLRLAWFNRELENTEESKRYIEMALSAFLSSYELEKFEETPEKEIEIIYLIGELNRQLGNYKDAVRWFDMTIKHEFIYKNRLLKLYAKEQWALSVEEKKSKTL